MVFLKVVSETLLYFYEKVFYKNTAIFSGVFNGDFALCSDEQVCI